MAPGRNCFISGMLALHVVLELGSSEMLFSSFTIYLRDELLGDGVGYRLPSTKISALVFVYTLYTFSLVLI